MVILISMIAFVSSNVDDLFILTFLFAQTNRKKEQLNILIGQYVGMAIIMILSFLLAFCFRSIGQLSFHYLGLVPILIGLKKAIEIPKKVARDKTQITVFQVTALTIAGGGENLGIYIPILLTINLANQLLFVVTFAFLIPIWWLIGKIIGRHQVVIRLIHRQEKIVVPCIYLVVGLWLFFG
ncbi:cadmium resistance transporter [Fructobacillus fructosus]|uniref:cadmium resistance transporter n=1 Tax=Fructobacillus fructosus TaxID=1631 RepID=UPI002D9BCA9A|nr:Cadmium resistance protein CadD [Fructobacillus fructosus]CAK1248474.1 Cadmium resistance protein CadD [Fructobacillus fructosus]CAK1249258.1 Cadmium resistance protein CadD [Fructobacillus fructosus]